MEIVTATAGLDSNNVAPSRVPLQGARCFPFCQAFSIQFKRLIVTLFQRPCHANVVLAVATALSCSACERHLIPWTPDPRVAHADTAFMSGGVRIAVERMAPLRSGRHPLVLVLHGSDGPDGNGGQYVRGYADQLALNGYVAYVVHYFDRTGTTRSDDALEDREFPIWTETLRDAITFAQHDSSVDARRVGAFGFSLGGYMSLALGASDPRVGSLVVLGGGFFKALAPRVTHLPPTLLLHGGDDTVVPLHEAEKVAEALARLHVAHQLVVFPGAGHVFTVNRTEGTAVRAIRWFDRYVNGRWWRRILPLRQTSRTTVTSSN